MKKLLLILMSICSLQPMVDAVAFSSIISKIIEPNVLALEVPAVKDEPVRFELSFTGSPAKYETRKFITGAVGDVKIK
jgi:hypothetical protein